MRVLSLLGNSHNHHSKDRPCFCLWQGQNSETPWLLESPMALASPYLDGCLLVILEASVIKDQRLACRERRK